jgi:hypothetical protein
MQTMYNARPDFLTARPFRAKRQTVTRSPRPGGSIGTPAKVMYSLIEARKMPIFSPEIGSRPAFRARHDYRK